MGSSHGAGRFRWFIYGPIQQQCMVKIDHFGGSIALQQREGKRLITALALRGSVRTPLFGRIDPLSSRVRLWKIHRRILTISHSLLICPIGCHLSAAIKFSNGIKPVAQRQPVSCAAAGVDRHLRVGPREIPHAQQDLPSRQAAQRQLRHCKSILLLD